MLNDIEWAPSLMCADFSRLGEEIHNLTHAGVHRWHFDVMDGHFVPNLTLGPDVLVSVRQLTQLPIDVHLMVESPEQFVEMMIDAGADRIYFHIEATRTPSRLIRHIRSRGVQAGVAINPATPPAFLESILHEVDGILVMTVDPGFAGQAFMPHVVDHIAYLKGQLDERNLQVPLMVDGQMHLQTVPRVVNAGAKQIVLGTSGLFRESDYEAALKRLQESATSGGISLG